MIGLGEATGEELETGVQKTEERRPDALDGQGPWIKRLRIQPG